MNIPSSITYMTKVGVSWGTTPPRKIFVTNDDGPPSSQAPYLSIFLRVLQTSLQPYLEDLFVCVPSMQQSWMGKRIDRQTPISGRILARPFTPFNDNHSISSEAKVTWALMDSSPATTVQVGLHSLCPFEPSLVISGPNFGHNCGSAYQLSSGTIGGAMEASILGRRAVSLNIGYFVSPESHTQEQIESSCIVLLRALSSLWSRWPVANESDTIFNITVPLGCCIDAKILFCPVFHHSYGKLYKQVKSELSLSHDDNSNVDEEVVFETDELEFNNHPTKGSDRWAIENGFVSVSALKPRFYEPKNVEQIFTSSKSL